METSTKHRSICLDLLLASNGKDIEVYTDRYVYVREFSGNIRKK